jgi:hypothetical protein
MHEGAIQEFYLHYIKIKRVCAKSAQYEFHEELHNP